MKNLQLASWFVAKLGVAVDETDESVLWLTLIVQSGIKQGADAQDLLTEGKEILAILSKSHGTARENRQQRIKNKKKRN